MPVWRENFGSVCSVHSTHSAHSGVLAAGDPNRDVRSAWCRVSTMQRCRARAARAAWAKWHGTHGTCVRHSVAHSPYTVGPRLQFHQQVVDAFCGEASHPCPSGHRRVSQYRRSSVPAAGCQGQVFREVVAEQLQRRDALKTSPEDIIFFDDSTLATTCAIELLAGDGGAVLVPFPGFPSTYRASASAGKQPIPYFLDATASWDVTLETLEALGKMIQKQGAQGAHVIRVLALQNPGPAGQLLSAECLQRCLEFAAEQGLGVMVQEDDSLVHGRDFVYCRQVAQQLKSDVRIVTCVAMPDLSEQVGEQMGAFLQLQNVGHSPNLLSSRKAPTLRSQVWISSLLSGIPLDSSVYATARAHEDKIKKVLSLNAAKARSVFNDVSGMYCAETLAGAHVFPQITVKGFLMKKAISLGRPADDVYSSQLLERTGITTEPGCCFGERPGSFHFRLPMLQSSNSFEEMLEKIQKFHLEHPDGWFQ